MVGAECSLLHKDGMNNILPTSVMFHSVLRYGYCVSCTITTILCHAYRNTLVHLLFWCHTEYGPHGKWTPTQVHTPNRIWTLMVHILLQNMDPS